MTRLLLCATLLLAVLPARAQESRGALLGRVTDPSGSVVAGASVKVVNEATNTGAGTTTNQSGNYELPYLLPGMYRLEVELTGFKKFVRSGVELRVDDRRAVDVSLEMGDVRQVVEVTAEVPVLETATASLGAVVQTRQISELPFTNGNPLLAAQLAPGITGYARPGVDSLPGATAHPNNFAIGGSRSKGAEISLDGSPNMQRNDVAFIPPNDIIEELKVQTASYDASIGHTASGVVNAVIKSGGNRFHGSLFEFNTSGPMNGTDFFTNQFIYDPRTGPITDEKKRASHPKEILNRYGGTLTGPFWLPRIYNGKDRTFFSYGYQGFNRLSTNNNQLTVPTAENRAGDFSNLLALGSQYQIYDPATIAPAPTAGRFKRDPLPGNRVPASRIDPMAKTLMAYWPMPNAIGTVDGRSNYNVSPPIKVDFWSHVGRIDHVFTPASRMFGRITKNELLRDADNVFSNISRSTLRSAWNNSFTADYVHVFGPGFLMNVKFGVNRFDELYGSRSQGMDLTALGFPSKLVAQLDPRGITFPQVDVAGVASLGADGGTRDITNYYSWAANFTHMRGNHSVKFGLDYRILQENGIAWGNVSPNIAFDTAWTRGPLDNSPVAPGSMGQGMASFLLGLPTGGAIDFAPFDAEQSGYMGLYVQDDWKVTRRLTVNIGLRYERDLPTTERFNRSVRQFDFTTPNPIDRAAAAAYARSPIPEIPAAQFRSLGGLTFAGVGGNPRELWSADNNNFAPRIGFAFSLNPSMVMRGGYGIFFESRGVDRAHINATGFSIANQLVPSLDNGQTFRATLRDPFPDPLTPPPGAADGLLTNIGKGATFFDTKGVNPYVQRWSFGLQKELPNRILLEASYVGSRSAKQRISAQLNPVPQQYLTRAPLRDEAAVNFLTSQVANPYFGILPAGAGLTGRNVARSQLLKPYPHFTGVSAAYPAGSAWYHSLQARAEKRFSGGYMLSGSYTWSKFMEAMSYLNDTDMAPEHAIAAQDRPHRLVVHGLYELPFHARGPLRHVVDGWQVNAIYTAQSGPAIGFGNVAFFGDPHDLVLPRGQRTPDLWFNIDAGFNRDSRQQPANNIRTLPSRFTGLRADGQNYWSLSLLKSFTLREGLKLQLRADAQNALNHAHFAAPNTAPVNPLFGTVNATASEPRVMFVGLRLVW